MVDRGLLEMLGLDPDDPDVQKSLEDAQAAHRQIDSLVHARQDQGISQETVAEHMETTQSAVSKLERAGSDPRLSTLQRYARAVNGRLATRFVLEGGDRALHYRVNVGPDDADEDLDDDGQPVLPAVRTGGL